MVRIVASARLPVPPKRASALILNPKMMEKWMIGVQGLRADAAWPFPNSAMSWEWNHGNEFCEARVTENLLPSSLTVDVTAPNHSRIVTHTFTETEDGGTNYERIVVTELRGLRKLFGTGRLRSQVNEEVRRAVSLVEEESARER